MTPDDLVPPDWPACWLFSIRGDVAASDSQVKPDRFEHGELAQYDRGFLTYSCPCGSTFKRAPGFQNDEARAWVMEHASHLSVANLNGVITA